MLTLKASLAGLAGAALAVAGIGYGALTMGTASAQPGPATCTGRFEVKTLSATGAVETAMAGALSLEIGGSGDIKGTLATADGSTSKLFGQVNGLSVGLAIEMDVDGQTGYVFGTGIAKYNPRECKGVMGGPATTEFPGKNPSNGAWLFTGDNPVE